MRSADAAIDARADVPLAPLTTLGVGGPAQWYAEASTVEQVQAAHRWAAERELSVFVLGGGSNVVVSDAGIRGLVLHIAIRGMRLQAGADEAVVEAGAGEPWDEVVQRVVAGGYAGFECLSGIPGLVGGTPIQNVGAYGQEVSDTIERVEVIDARTIEPLVIPGRECGFAYRQSRFKREDAGRYVVCRVVFRVRRGPPTVTYPDVVAWVDRSRLRRVEVSDVRRAVLEIRRSKGMVIDPDDADTRSVGSFFMNPIVPAAKQAELESPAFAMPDGRVKIPAAWLIERAGFGRGYVAGSAALSSRHPLAIVNRGGATAAEVVELACRVKGAVLDRFGIALRPEPVFAGWGDDQRVRFLGRAD